MTELNTIGLNTIGLNKMRFKKSARARRAAAAGMFIILALVMAFSLHVRAEDHDYHDPFGDYAEEITCENAAEVLEDHLNSIQLAFQAYGKSMRDLSQWLRGADSSLPHQRREKELEIQDVYYIIQEQTDSLPTRGENMLETLKGCL